MITNVNERKKAKIEREREKNLKTDREVRKKMKEIYDSFWKKKIAFDTDIKECN